MFDACLGLMQIEKLCSFKYQPQLTPINSLYVVMVPISFKYLNVNFYHTEFVDQATLYGWFQVS